MQALQKKNFPLFRALKPQPTSWVGWGSWLHSESLALRALPVARVHNNNPLAMLSSTTLLGKVMPGRSKVTVSVLTQQNNTRQRRAEPRHPSNPSFLLLGFIQPSRIHSNALYILTLKHLRKGICPNILLSIDKFCICCNRVIHALVSRTFQWSYIAVKKKMHHSSSKRIWSTSLLWPTPHCLALHLQYSSVGRSAEKEEPHESICVEGSLSHCLGEKMVARAQDKSPYTKLIHSKIKKKYKYSFAKTIYRHTNIGRLL